MDLNVTSLSENRAPPDTGVDSSARALSSTTGPGLANVTDIGLAPQLIADTGVVRDLAGVHRDVSCEMRAARI